jgi:hypothetical protein
MSKKRITLICNNGTQVTVDECNIKWTPYYSPDPFIQLSAILITEPNQTRHILVSQLCQVIETIVPDEQTETEGQNKEESK